MRIHNPNLIFSNNSLLLLRHGTDIPVLCSDLNPPLDPRFKDEFQELVSEVRLICSQKDNIRLSYSNRLRGKQSAEMLISGLGKKKSIKVCESDKIREVYHGHFKIINHTQGEKYPPLVDAWKLWAEALAEMDIDYRYGNPVRKGKNSYPRLNGIFTKFGENHREFTIRLYSFLVDLINLYHSNSSNLFNIVIAHQATLSRIQRVFNALFEMRRVPLPGKLVLEIERSSSRINIEESHGVIVRFPPRELSINVLQQEINHLKK